VTLGARLGASLAYGQSLGLPLSEQQAPDGAAEEAMTLIHVFM
jgi:hypothetical protein